MTAFATSGDGIVTTAILVGAALLALRAFAWNYVKSLWARGWTTVQGMVEFGSVEERRTRYKNIYIARIDYSYSVNNEYYSGYLEKTFIRERSADRFVSTLKGQVVFVRADPAHPERSALLEQDQPGGWPR